MSNPNDNIVISKGRTDYCRFILLGRGRTGSNFLRGLLNNHSEIITFGELFRDRDSIGWEIPAYEKLTQNDGLISLMNNAPIKFLEKKVFTRFPKQISAVGFKLFYYHAREDSNRVVWDFLQNQNIFKVIHIKRNNTLRMILSEKKAFKTDRWTNTTGEAERQFSVPIDYEECVKRFTLEQQMQEEFDCYFSGHPKLDLIYEDLSKGHTLEMKRIQNFLGVKYENVQPSTYKQANQPLSEAIQNYFELKERFLDTHWESFFEE